MTQIRIEFTRFAAFCQTLGCWRPHAEITEAAFAISVDVCCRGDNQ